MLYDFAKAFNSLEHSFLFSDFRILLFDDISLKFFFHYRLNRKMVIHGTKPRLCTCGVGQGSGSGGNLFCVCVNLMVIVFMFVKALVFVDDAQAYLHSLVGQINQAMQQVKADSLVLADSATLNGLRLNPEKNQAIIFGSQKNLRLLSE